MITTFLLLSALNVSILPSDWDKIDTTMLSILVVESVYDVMTTKYKLEHPTEGLDKEWVKRSGVHFEEADPLLGKNPGSLRLWGSFVVVHVVLVTTCILLPSKWRKIIEGFALGVESFNIWHNIQLDGHVTWKVSF